MFKILIGVLLAGLVIIIGIALVQVIQYGIKLQSYTGEDLKALCLGDYYAAKSRSELPVKCQQFYSDYSN